MSGALIPKAILDEPRPDVVLRVFQKSGANIDARGVRGLTALHLAAAECDLEKVRLLLGVHESPSIRSDRDGTLVTSACKDPGSVVGAPAAAGAEVNAMNIERSSLLMRAAMSRYTELVEAALAQQAAEVNRQNLRGETALSFAVQSHVPGSRIVEALLLHGADPTLTTSEGLNPINLATERKDDALVLLLKEYQAKRLSSGTPATRN